MVTSQRTNFGTSSERPFVVRGRLISQSSHRSSVLSTNSAISSNQHNQRENPNSPSSESEQQSNYSPANPLVVDNVVSVQTLFAHLNHIIRFTKIYHQDQNLFLRYLARAELRYLMWLNLLDQLRPQPDSIPMPPLDVALFWCAHTTNVLTYKEDLVRLFGEHMLDYNFPLLHMDAINAEGEDYVDADSSETWQSFSDEPYILEFDDHRPFLISCPFCMEGNTIDPDTYVQLKMNAVSHSCENCSLELNADILSAKRLLNDIQYFLLDDVNCLAGTLLDTEKNQIDIYMAVNDNKLLFDHDFIRELIRLVSPVYTGIASPPSLYVPNITKNCNWHNIQREFSAVLYRLEMQGELCNVRKNILSKIITAYQNLFTPFSLDLIAAVIRYKETVEKILCNGDWENENVVAVSTVRYHKFMMLTEKHPDRILVPTMDILLCWYTHMLWPSKYYAFTIGLTGKILDHVNSLSESKMIANFEKTALLWHKKYQEPYTSEDPSKKWKSSSRVVMSFVFPVYGLYVAQKLWKLNKTHDKRIGPGGSVHMSMYITSGSNDINSLERRGPYTFGVNIEDSELMNYQDNMGSPPSRVFTYINPEIQIT